MSEERVLRAFASRPILLEKTFTFADLAAGGSAALPLSLGRAPVGSWLQSYAVQPTVNFAGGSLSQVNATIGPTADPDQVASAIALHTGTADGRLRNGTAGINPFGPGYGGTELFLTVTPTGGLLSEADAGSVKVSLLFVAGDKNAAL